jgi:hypothetical protein
MSCWFANSPTPWSGWIAYPPAEPSRRRCGSRGRAAPAAYTVEMDPEAQMRFVLDALARMAARGEAPEARQEDHAARLRDHEARLREHETWQRESEARAVLRSPWATISLCEKSTRPKPFRPGSGSCVTRRPAHGSPRAFAAWRSATPATSDL